MALPSPISYVQSASSGSVGVVSRAVVGLVDDGLILDLDLGQSIMNPL